MFAMKLKLFLFIFYVTASHCETKVVERSLVNFAQMIRSVTATDPFELIGHGNWCGLGGGGQAVDSLDLCCETHDKCYDRVAERCGSTITDYVTSYDWELENETNIVCADETASTRCAVMLCDCDKIAVECFMKYHNFDPNKKTSRLE